MSLLKMSLFFFIVAIVAALFGFTGIAVAAAGVARIIFAIFLVLFLATLLFGLLIGAGLFGR